VHKFETSVILRWSYPCAYPKSGRDILGASRHAAVSSSYWKQASMTAQAPFEGVAAWLIYSHDRDPLPK
jgi:hypothetical protein